MRLPEHNDREAIGGAAGLNEEQRRELSKLETGVAVVIQNNWLEAVLTRVDRFSNAYEHKTPAVDYAAVRGLNTAVIQELMNQYIVEREMNIDRLMFKIDSAEIGSHKKQEMRLYMQRIYPQLAKRDVVLFAETLYNLTGANTLFDIIESTILPSDQTDQNKYSIDSINEWKTKLRDGLRQSVTLPDEYIHTMIDYLLFVQEERVKRIDYFEVQRILEQDVR